MFTVLDPDALTFATICGLAAPVLMIFAMKWMQLRRILKRRDQQRTRSQRAVAALRQMNPARLP